MATGYVLVMCIRNICGLDVDFFYFYYFLFFCVVWLAHCGSVMQLMMGKYKYSSCVVDCVRCIVQGHL